MSITRWVIAVSKRETNLERCRDIAKSLLRVDLRESSIPFICSHPFTNTWLSCYNGKTLDLHNQADREIWVAALSESIDRSDILGIMCLVNSPYKLTVIKFLSSYLSDKDLGALLSGFWQQQEQISLDRNVTGVELVKWFKRADKSSLMGASILKRYNALPARVTVYRGVTERNKNKKKALSWTLDRNVAVWFANRFNTGTGEVWKITVPKERILCLFDGEEHEVIVDLYRYKEPISVIKV